MFSLQCLSLTLGTRKSEIYSMVSFCDNIVYSILFWGRECVFGFSEKLRIQYQMLGIFICCLALSQYKAFKRKICIYSGMWHGCVHCTRSHVSAVHEKLLTKQRAILNFNVDSIYTHTRSNIRICMCLWPDKNLAKECQQNSSVA